MGSISILQLRVDIKILNEDFCGQPASWSDAVSN